MKDVYLEIAGSVVVEVRCETAHKRHFVDSDLCIVEGADCEYVRISSLSEGEKFCIDVVRVFPCQIIKHLKIVSHLV